MIFAHGLGPSRSVDSLRAASNHTSLIGHCEILSIPHSPARLHSRVYKVYRMVMVESNAGLRLSQLDGMATIRLFRLPCAFLFESPCYRS